MASPLHRLLARMSALSLRMSDPVITLASAEQVKQALGQLAERANPYYLLNNALDAGLLAKIGSGLYVHRDAGVLRP
jgi:hypothetical protein